MGNWNLSLSTTAWTLQGPQSLAAISFTKLAWKMKRRMPEPGAGGRNRGQMERCNQLLAALMTSKLKVCVLPSGCGCVLNPNSREKSGPSQSLWQARGKTGSSSTRRDSKYARIVSSATLDSLRATQNMPGVQLITTLKPNVHSNNARILLTLLVEVVNLRM